jgi:hypothetical protein
MHCVQYDHIWLHLLQDLNLNFYDHIWNFFRLPGMTLRKQNVATKSVTSTDGTITIPQTNNCARKPRQRKCVRNAKTYSSKKLNDCWILLKLVKFCAYDNLVYLTWILKMYQILHSTCISDLVATFCFFKPWVKNLCNRVSFSFWCLLCQIILVHCKWLTGRVKFILTMTIA